MQNVQRILNLLTLLNKKSFFLFGPRGTGKSFLIRHQLANIKVYDLLDARVFARLSRRPTLIEEELQKDERIIVIDEIQKLPKLLDEVHRLIENKNIKFLLTGSSARKLKKGAANLLAGRAWEARLFPLVSHELQPDFDLNHYLCVGGLPAIYQSPDPWEELKAYTGTYLKEEIIAEAAVRKLDSFIAFLDIAATKVGEEINYESLASDCAISARSIEAFFTVLEDTLLGFRLKPFRKTQQRKAIARSKFYFSDVGITNSLLGRKEIPRATEAYGECFEHFIILELRAYLSYYRRDEKLSYWRTHAGFEVDVLVGQKLAIEIKATTMVQTKHLKGIKALKEEQLFKHYSVVSHDIAERNLDGITIYPWQLFLQKLWNHEFFI